MKKTGKEFLIEKIIHSIENENPYTISVEKKIIREIEKTYKVCRRVCQSLFVDIGDTFIEYIQSLDTDEIQQIDDDLKANGWGIRSVMEAENAFDLLCIFQMFYQHKEASTDK